MSTEERERLDGVRVDVDTRLSELWLLVTEPGNAVADDPDLRVLVGSVMRAAYITGYRDALNEDRAGRRAELHRTHGYKPE